MDKEAAYTRMGKMVLAAVGAASITFIGFPPIAYASFFTYGIPADIFIVAAYGIWLGLLQTDRKIGYAFLVGFLPVVAFWIVLIFRVKLSYGLLLTLPLACVCLVHWLIVSRR